MTPLALYGFALITTVALVHLVFRYISLRKQCALFADAPADSLTAGQRLSQIEKINTKGMAIIMALVSTLCLSLALQGANRPKNGFIVIEAEEYRNHLNGELVNLRAMGVPEFKTKSDAIEAMKAGGVFVGARGAYVVKGNKSLTPQVQARLDFDTGTQQFVWITK